MNYKQDVAPNLSQTGTVGDCLAYAHEMFGAPGGILWAWQAWENTQYRHLDQDFPTDAAILMWYSYAGTEGHVTVNVPGQGIYSSPYQPGTSHAVLGSIADVERIYGVAYVGWSEDINGVRVAEPIPQYNTTPITPKLVLVTPGMHEWNLSLATFDDVDNNPFTTAGSNHVITAVATLVRPDFPQFTYYLENVSSPLGWNTVDCEDYTPPVAPPAPYVPPAKPETAKPAQTYKLLTTLPTYASAPDAMAGTNGAAPLVPGVYYVWGTSDKAIQLGPDNMHEPTGNWVNTLYNKAPVPVTPDVVPTPKPQLPSDVQPSGDNDTIWRSTYKPLHPDGSSETYILLQDVRMVDYSGKRQYVILRSGTKVNVTGTFVKDGVTFYRVRANNDVAYAWWYGISMYNDDSQPNIKKQVGTIAADEQKLGDIWYYLRQDIRKWMDVKIRKGK